MVDIGLWATTSADAAHEECVRQLMNTDKQVVAHPERGEAGCKVSTHPLMPLGAR